MKINKQGITYIFIYISAIIILVGTGLAFTYMSLKDKQQANADADKMKQILASVHITAPEGKIVEEFDKYITKEYLVDMEGKTVPGKAFTVNVAAESKKPAQERVLPVYECNLGEKGLKYILPVYGAGLWGPIWGYVALDADGSTIYGAYFSHQGETPGLGAKIEEPAFSGQFDNKHMFCDSKFIPVTVVKKGQKPTNGGEYVNAVSGATITSKGVAAMMDNCLAPYEAFLTAAAAKYSSTGNSGKANDK